MTVARLSRSAAASSRSDGSRVSVAIRPSSTSAVMPRRPAPRRPGRAWCAGRAAGRRARGRRSATRWPCRRLSHANGLARPGRIPHDWLGYSLDWSGIAEQWPAHRSTAAAPARASSTSGWCSTASSGALQVRSGLGLDPWDVFHQGLADAPRAGDRHASSIIVGAAVLLLWIPLRQRPGLGTRQQRGADRRRR